MNGDVETWLFPRGVRHHTTNPPPFNIHVSLVVLATHLQGQGVCVGGCGCVVDVARYFSKLEGGGEAGGGEDAGF